jgi:glycosyltransferase involved in cell wall biosynthesis
MRPDQRRRIAWAGPWNTRSAIAGFGSLVVGELAARGHEIVVYRTETGEMLHRIPLRPAPGPVLWLGDAVPEALSRDYDAVIINLGDHYGHHGAAIASLLRVPFLVILHDAFLADLYAGWAEAEGRHSEHPVVLGAVYGDAEAKTAEPLMLPVEEMARRRPMLEWFAAFAAGAVVHASHYAERVRAVCPGPVEVIPLAYEGVPLPAPPREMGREVVVATVGHVNRNKRVADMLRAVSDSALLQECVRYRLIGAAEPAEQEALVSLARSLGVREPEFTGWVEEADMPRHLAAVDAICCLRNPVLEGASASLILGLRTGRPVLVSDHGPYAEIPDGLVLKCRPGHEATDLRLHLEALLADPAPARAMAQHARAYAEATFTASGYADRLLAHIDRVTEGLPAVRAAMGLGRTLAGFGMAPDDPAADRVAAALDDLLDRRRA